MSNEDMARPPRVMEDLTTDVGAVAVVVLPDLFFFRSEYRR